MGGVHRVAVTPDPDLSQHLAEQPHVAGVHPVAAGDLRLAGEVDVISAFSTDGRIAAYDLVLLDDPREAIPPYDAVLLLAPGATVRRPGLP